MCEPQRQKLVEIPQAELPYAEPEHTPDNSMVARLLAIADAQSEGATVDGILAMVGVPTQERAQAVDILALYELEVEERDYTNGVYTLTTEGGNEIVCKDKYMARYMSKMGDTETAALLAYVTLKTNTALDNIEPGDSVILLICSVCWIRGCQIGPMVPLEVS
jgi:hypothetical protein